MSGKSDSNPPNPLGISWHDSAWINALDGSNVLDYFSDRSNPFYDRMCNNETDPILYIIRKQHRHSRTQVTPQADYYVLAGVVYQAPDLNTALNSRLLSTVFHLQGAFEQTHSFSRYHPSRGYWWDFGKEEEAKKDKASDQKESGSLFQRRRVDLLLGELAQRFPPKIPAPQPPVQAAAAVAAPPNAAQAGSGAPAPTQNGTATSATNNAAIQPANQKPGLTRPTEGGIPEKRARLN